LTTTIHLIEQWENNQFNSFDELLEIISASDSMTCLSFAEACIHLQHPFLLEQIMNNLQPQEVAVLEVVRHRYEGSSDLLDSIEKAIEICSTKEHRDVHLEGRLRMERGLVRFEQGDFDGAESDLTWAETRLKSVSKASRDHDLSLLNKAAFHMARGEQLMALQVYGDISRHGGHAHETIAISRLGASRIHYELGHDFDAARHAWNAHYHSILANQLLMAIEAGTLFIEISLHHQDSEAVPMQIQVEESTPRDLKGDLPQLRVQPDDLKKVYSWCLEHIERNISGLHRPDLQALLRISLHLDELDSMSFLLHHPENVEDAFLASLCMSIVSDAEDVAKWNARLSVLSQL
jgi:hypothetical protein